jgi:hypothetical protein
MRSLRRSLLLLALLASCGASEEDVMRRFAAYVAGANHCTAVTECAVVFPGCPLGCATAVRADRAADVERTAKSLIAEYERGGARCVYDCNVPKDLVCAEGRCGFAPD